MKNLYQTLMALLVVAAVGFAALSVSPFFTGVAALHPALMAILLAILAHIAQTSARQ